MYITYYRALAICFCFFVDLFDFDFHALNCNNFYPVSVARIETNNTTHIISIFASDQLIGKKGNPNIFNKIQIAFVVRNIHTCNIALVANLLTNRTPYE